jgi:hypothetical protein
MSETCHRNHGNLSQTLLDLLIKHEALIGTIQMCDLQIPWDGVGHIKQRGSLLMLTTELGFIWNRREIGSAP